MLRSVSKESACCVGDPSLISGSGRSTREGNGNPLQYSYWKISQTEKADWAIVHEVTRLRQDLGPKPPHWIQEDLSSK